MIKSNDNRAIIVKDVTKHFKVYYDKPNTLKEKLVFWKNNKADLRTVLKDINLEINKGETVALIGVNGSGKSTLLKLMTKIIYPNKGEIITNGKLTSLLELGAGFHDDFTGRENIYFNASIFGLTRKEIDKRINQIIKFSELEKLADILLIDEILAVGDQHFQEKCFAKLEELKKSNKTIVIVSHSLDSIKKLCDRAVWINNGKIQADGECTEVIEKYLEECK